MKKSKGRRRRTLIAVIIIFVGSWKGLTSDQEKHCRKVLEIS
ncbi:hypothetical protein HanXRQr2_Chr06g0246251 [Helianthus annuus]|uniref:Uncharacterized protein n=1 Tax=Helianthus annuus TaxID=4232 RepID=A0A9K3NIW7_HELAN|nr:hypothetical protein HanXRQr2_Chr06g0246251 [Helianthus annuus]